MANRIKIRHGSGTPNKDQLLPYELGWNGTSLYINNGGTVEKVGKEYLPLTGGTLTGNLTLSGSAGIYYQGTKATYRMIRFIDNTSDSYGNGISIGGGGQTIIGGGESADTAAAQAGTAGGEIMQVCNDGNVELIANLQNGWNNRKTLTLNTSGYLMCPSYINVPTSNDENPTLSQFIVTNGSDNYYRKASVAHAMAAIRSNASGTWGITSTNTYNLLNYSGNECTIGGSSSATNTDIWINYRSGYGGSTSDSAAQLSNYHFGNRKGGTAGVAIYSNRFVGNSKASSWIDGQRYAYAPYNIGDITDTSGYWPWMRATSTAASKWFSFGVIGTSFYWIGSATSRTSNGYDYGMNFDVATGRLYVHGAAVIRDSGTTSRRIFVTTSASVPSDALAGDIVLVKV